MHVGATVKQKLIEEQGKENEFAKGVNQAMGKPDKKRQVTILIPQKCNFLILGFEM